MNFIYVGRLSPEKGVSTLLEAWGKLKSLCQKYSITFESQSLTIVGDGSEKEKLIQENTFEKISITGAIPRNIVTEKILNSDVLILPSLCYETFGIVIIECAKYGKPSIVGNIGGQATLIEDGVTGKTFETGNAESLASTMIEMILNPELVKKMGNSAKEHYINSNCPSSKNIKTLENIYQNTLNTKA